MKVERRFLLLIAVSNQRGHQVRDKVDDTAMSCVLNLANVLELVINRFTQGALDRMVKPRSNEDHEG